ncbi:MAG: hypothetical protein AUJ49_02115 [Desulfovibrionaceae bacterium CG1_02_65_16]|nr:MAG: hypothetical protein AUJ49_02115 [Desulfovibrionaceae bacterium CG1_02_65_16]
MIVKATAGLRVPKEGKPRQYITETDAVDVPATAYYLRAVACGDLVRVAPVTATKTTKAATTGQDKE